MTYDYRGNATSIRQTGSAIDEIFAEFDYNANGLLTSVRRYEVDADDVATSIANSIYEYNANNAVTSIMHNNSNGTQIVKHSYTYDSTNNIVEYLNSLDGTTTYDYDFLGQLISADYSNAEITDESYSYDSNGNRIVANGSTYTTSTNNELTSDGAWSYTYDDEGNRLTKTNSTNRELYTWDYRNRLTSVTQQTYNAETETWITTQIIEYTYDYNNVWIRKINGSDKTIFIPENYQTTVQIDNNTITHHYLWTPNAQDKLLADITPSAVLWSLTDHLGTIRDIIQSTATGIVTQAHVIYDAYGNIISCKNSEGQTVDNPLLFAYTGKAFDVDTQLQNNINRWYDATTGRWLTPDPIGFEGNDTNLYRYVGNQILKILDMNGLWWWDGDYISHGLGGLAGFWGSEVAVEGWREIPKGAAATVDGIVPFFDPLERVYVNECGKVEPVYQTSQHLGAISRDILMIARIPNLKVWSKNPWQYEIGSTSVSTPIYKEYLEGLSAVEKAAWIQKNGGFFKLVNWKQMVKNIPTGPTPGAWIAIIGTGEGVDAHLRIKKHSENSECNSCN